MQLQTEPEKPDKRARGQGSLFQNGSATWWVSYSSRGIRHRESSGSTDRSAAEKLLKHRLAEIETQVFIPRASVRVDELISDLFARYREEQQKSIDTAEQRWRLHLKPFFTRRKAGDLSTDMVRRYIAQRQSQGAAPASCNRELAILKRALNLALESTPPKIRVVPFIPMFREDNTRTGFLADADQARLARECATKGLWLRTAFAIGVTYGWRLSEILGLRVRQVDLADRSVRLEVGSTKNNHGRIVSLTEECFTLLQACCVGKKADDHVLTRDGEPVLDFRGAWQYAVVRAGLGKFVCRKCKHEQATKARCKCGNRHRWRFDGLLFHDLRRTAVRNLRRLGVSETVSMKISGHRTASVFKRYDIIEQADLVDAAARLDVKQKSNALQEVALCQSSARATQNSTQTSATADPKMIAAVLPN